MMIWLDSHLTDGLLDGLSVEDRGRRIGVDGAPDQMVRFAIDLDSRARQIIEAAGTDPGTDRQDAHSLQKTALQIRDRLLA